MDDLAHRFERIRPGIDDAWSESQVAEARARLDARLRRRRGVRRGAAVAIALVPVAAVLYWVLRPADQGGASPEPAPAPAPAPLAGEQPSDSTPPAPEAGASPIVTRSDGPARMRVLRDLPDRTEIGLDSGRVNFEVDLSAGKQVTVHAGDVVIQVHSSAFAVERTERGVGLWVQEGWLGVVRDDRTVLAEGEHVWLSASDGRDRPRPEPGPSEPDEPRPPPEPAPLDGDWRDAARAGRFHEAYTALFYEGATVEDTVDDLLLAADTARMSNHAADAVEPLQRIARDHADDSRAALANYTLGRVYLHQLGQPRAAAEAFATARRGDLDSSLAEDALARETEAWSRAGDDERARARAEEYLRAYPDGYWSDSVRSFGGLE